ncbi:PorV/PorQ family protein [Melioribacteraceae bacterium 4301-Me]|uniref:PorV/PorQ family protein n=1 Tax=Pyranulibacter aquaticus TaxID=3163344 RepID=UPI003599C82D
MNNYFKSIIIITLNLMLLEGRLYAQFEKKAQVGFRFLSNPIAAEVVGKGATGITTTVNSNGIFWNPALLSLVEPKVDVGLNHTEGIADIDYNAAAVSFKLSDIGVIGVSFLAMDYGDFYATRRASNEQGFIETGVFSPTGIAVGIAFSQKVSDRFSYGVHLKFVSQDLGSAWIATAGDNLNDPNLSLTQQEYTNSTIAADVGAFYDFHYKGIKFAAVLQNISKELKYVNEEFPLPFSISFGLSIQPLDFFMNMQEEQSFILNFESVHPRDYKEKVKIGGEYKFMNTLFLRAGYMMNYDERGWTAGIGFKYMVSQIPFRIDYAYEPFGVLGDRHYFSVGISY